MAIDTGTTIADIPQAVRAAGEMIGTLVGLGGDPDGLQRLQGLPAGLGLQAATGQRPLVLVGDGAFQMTGWELGNARRYGWDPIVLVFNNAGWEMLRAFQPESKFNDLGEWRFADMAAALGGTQQAARAFATSPQAISNWKRRQRLPASRQLQALQIARKKRVEYVDDDAKLNKILIELGTDEVRLRNLSDKKELSQKQLAEILELLEALDKYAIALRRHGGDFSEYVEQRHKKTHEFPRHMVKVRDGNDESVHYFHSEEELAQFGTKNADLKLFGEEESDTSLIEKAKNGHTRRARPRRRGARGRAARDRHGAPRVGAHRRSAPRSRRRGSRGRAARCRVAGTAPAAPSNAGPRC